MKQSLIQQKKNDQKTYTSVYNERVKGGYRLYDKSDSWSLIDLDNINLMKEISYCYQNEEQFNYHNIPKALC